MEVIESLRQVPLFSNMSEKNLKRVAKACKVRKFDAEDAIVRQGDDGVGLFIITKGRVKVVKQTAGGRKLEIAMHGPGEFFGEFSVIDGAKRTASVIAVEPCECIVVVSWDFRAMMENHPRIALQILPVLTARFRETNARLISLTEPEGN